jgi:Cu/Ag efflux pump CusA
VKVFGPDLDVLQHTAQQIQGVMASVPGVADLAIEQQTGVPQVAIQFDRAALSLHGLRSADLAETVQAAFFGTKVSDVIEQQKTFPLLVRYDPKQASNIETMRQTLVDTSDGGKVPLGTLADVRIVNGPSIINRENAQRRTVVSCNVSSGSLTGVVEEIKRRVGRSVKVPVGYYVVYGGQ